MYWAASSTVARTPSEPGATTKSEMITVTTTMGVADKVMGLMSKEVTVSADEGLREGTTYEGIKDLRTALPGGVISAGNASQFSDGASAINT